MKEDDILFCLGDWSFSGVYNIWNFRKQLNIKNIHLILGNHDSHIRDNKELPNCFWNTSTEQIKYTDGSYSRDTQEINTSLTSDETETKARAQDVFTSVQDVMSISHGKHSFFLSHYAHLTWPGKNSIMLHGHSHGNINHLNVGVRRLDVGIDSAKLFLGEYRPFSIDEIINIIDPLEIKDK